MFSIRKLCSNIHLSIMLSQFILFFQKFILPNKDKKNWVVQDWE